MSQTFPLNISEELDPFQMKRKVFRKTSGVLLCTFADWM